MEKKDGGKSSLQLGSKKEIIQQKSKRERNRLKAMFVQYFLQRLSYSYSNGSLPSQDPSHPGNLKWVLREPLKQGPFPTLPVSRYSKVILLL